MERLETKKIKTVDEQIEMRYRKLLIYLDGRVAEIDHIRFLAKTYLTSKELSSEKFLDICSNLETKGELGPNNLDLMKEFFTEDKDKDAYSAIVKAEKDIAGHTIPATITAKEIIPHTVPEDNIVIAIKTSFKINIDLINKSNLSFEERTDAMQKSASAHKEALEFCTMYDSIIRNGFCMSHTNGGSLRLFFRFFSRQGIVRFKEMYHSGELLTILQSGLITDELLDDCNAQSVKLDVKISDEDIKVCLDKIGDEVDTDNTAPSATNKDADNEYEQRRVESQLAQLSNLDKLPDELAECPYHQQNRIEFVCSNPQCQYAFLCQKCIDENHKTHRRVDIAQFANEKKEILQARTAVGHDRFLASLKQEIVSTEDRISENRSKTTTEKEKIFQKCKEMKDELDKIAVKYASACETIGDANEKKLLSHLEWLRTLFTECETELQQCEETLANGSPCDIILIEKAGLPKPPDRLEPPEINILEFNLKMISNDQLEELFGDVTSLTREPIKVVDDLLYTFQERNAPCVFVLDIDDNNSCTQIYPHLDDIYIWFNKSNSLLVVNKSGDIKNKISLQSEEKNTKITSIAFSYDIIWTMDNKGCVQQIKGDGTLEHSFMHNRHCYSLHVLRNDLLIVGMKGLVQILTTTGKAVCELTTKRFDIRVVYFITQCRKTGNLALSDLQHLSVVTENLKHLYTIRGETLTSADGNNRNTGYNAEGNFEPNSICFDEDGDLLVIDQKNSRVVMFDNSGQYVRTIVDTAMSEESPSAINTTPGGTLWIAFDDNAFYSVNYK